MILLSAVVGQDFKEEIDRHEWTRNLKPYIGDHKLHLISDLSGWEDYEVIPYNSHIWNYVDKILYSFIISQKYNDSVLWIDYNKFHKHHQWISYPKPEEFLVEDLWWIKENGDEYRTQENTIIFSDMIKRNWICWEPIKDYIIKFGLRDDFNIPIEEVFYLPKGLSNDLVIRTIETLKVIVSYCSYISDFPYKTINGEIGIGNGEGIILPLLSQQFGFNLRLFDIQTPISKPLI